MRPACLRLRPALQTYAWGSQSEFRDRFGVPNPEHAPQAELWWGAHPKGPATVLDVPGEPSLDEWIRADPAARLGAQWAASEDAALPFLCKLLAVDAPLSVQCHPNRAQAEAGYADEAKRGLAADAPDRNYRDPRAKPELICAISRFEALCGFRSPEAITPDLAPLRSIAPLSAAIDALFATPTPEMVLAFLRRVLSLSEADAAATAAAIQTALAAQTSEGTATVRALAEHYPKDPSIVVGLLLHPVTLEPGEAMYLPPGQLHAYRRGCALEVMGNSDNVLRGGLTVKHVDVNELSRVVDPAPRAPDRLVPEPGTGLRAFPPRSEAFRLHRLDARATPETIPADPGPRILIATAGTIELGDGETTLLRAGEAVWMPPETTLPAAGDGTLYVCGAPPPPTDAPPF